MKIIEYNYSHPKYNKPTVKISRGFFGKLISTYVCESVGKFHAKWICIETGKIVNSDSKLYDLLNDTGRKMQLEWKE